MRIERAKRLLEVEPADLSGRTIDGVAVVKMLPYWRAGHMAEWA